MFIRLPDNIRNNSLLWFEMPLYQFALFIGFLILCIAACPMAALSMVNLDTRTSKFVDVSLPFIENKGQADQNVRFYVRSFATSLFVTKTGELIYAVPVREKSKAKKAGEDNGKNIIFSEKLVHAAKPMLEGQHTYPAVVNVYHGDRRTWRENIPAYHKLNFGDVYPGITLELKADGKGIEKLFYIEPNGNIDAIRLRIDGAENLSIADSGQLVVATRDGQIRFTAPRAFQEINGERKPVEIAYRVEGNQYGFTIGDYDKTRTLIIDPLLASSYLGGSDNDLGNALAISGNNIVIAGQTQSIDFPVSGTSDPAGDVMVALLDPELQNLVFVTVFGGAATETAVDMVVTGSAVYLAGITTSDDFPAVGAGYSNSGASYIARLTPDLVLQTTTRFPAILNALAVDSAGDVFIAGFTDGLLPGTDANTPTNPDDDGFQTALVGAYDGFVAKFASGLDALKVSTYLGGTEASSQADSIHSIAIDAAGDVFVAGMTTAADFPMGLLPSYDEEYAHTPGDPFWDDIFVTRLSNNLHLLAASTYLGGLKQDNLGFYRTGTLLVNSDSVYVAGETESLDFPVNSTFGPVALRDAFVTRLNKNLSDLDESIRIGGDLYEGITAIAKYANDIFVAGYTSSVNFPTTPNAYMTNPENFYNGGFICHFDDELLALKASTYVAGLLEEINGLAIDATGNIVIGGHLRYDGYPTTALAYQKTLAGGSDVFISRFTSDLSAGGILVDQTTLNFGEVRVGDGASEAVSLSNNSTASVTVSDIKFTEGSSSDFIQANDCIGLLSPFAQCTIVIDFKPTTATTQNGSLLIESSDAANPQIEILLTGKGIEPDIQVIPDSLVLTGYPDSNELGDSSAGTIQITNTGAAPLNVIDFYLQGPDQDQFIEDANTDCTALLDKDQSCTYVITYKPDVASDPSHLAELIIVSDDPDTSRYTVFLEGTTPDPVIVFYESGGCISSVAFGSNTHKHLETLREFRDRYLMTTELGRALVRYYYNYSPSAAHYLTEHEWLRAMTRYMLKFVAYAIEYPSGFILVLLATFMIPASRRSRLRHTRDDWSRTGISITAGVKQ
jgi:hypothetical protein